MRIVHGTWIPAEGDTYIQPGMFWLWVETDALIRRSQPVKANRVHRRQLSGGDLEGFLLETLKIEMPYGVPPSRQFALKHFVLPSADDRPLPSAEMAPYVDEDLPDEHDMASWHVCCFPLRTAITDLNDIHYVASYGAMDFQLGTDFLFWWQYSQEIKRLILADQYIPSLTYRPLAVKRKRDPAYELHAGWEFCTDEYESVVQRYAACMPAVCAAGSESPGVSGLYAPEPLLRHFGENMLHSAVVGTSSTAKLDKQVAGTPIHTCLHPYEAVPAADHALALYRDWLDWRQHLTSTHRDAGFTLYFRLEEASPADEDSWRVQFVVASKRDPSFKLPLEEYWTLRGRERKMLVGHLGTDFERYLLLALGYAARIYPAVWEGLETDRPSGFTLTLEEALAFLKEHAWVLQDAGYGVIVPSWWTREGRRRIKVRLSTSTRSGAAAGKSYFDLDSVLNYRYKLSIDGQPLTDAEWRQLVNAKSSLVQFRGQWMELDRDRIRQLVEQWDKRHLEQPEMTLLELMKVGADAEEDLEWDHDATIREVLEALREKRSPQEMDDPINFRGDLREYQKRGVAWLRFLESLRLNPCLADDMGLGKTVQVIAQLVAERNDGDGVGPTLLIAPTSVLGNWAKEIERFAPHLRVLPHHGPQRQRALPELRSALAESDVAITSFTLARMDEKLLRGIAWQRVVVDEAQNIKNPNTAQTKAIARLQARHRLALTGTPVENRLRDLWSIFNFLNPGYLGKEAQFRRAFELPIQKNNDPERAATLKRLVEPLILRRVKTDRQIIRDLPDKIEQKVYCNLTPEQASLYEAVVRDVETRLEEAEGIQRRGMILATLMKLKQVCNHPAQFLHDGSEFSSDRSHKLQRLSEMAEEVIAEGESMLVFTQFTEIGDALEQYVRRTLHCNTYYLHGGTSATKRERMVSAFQDPETEPAVFILSVRAGGTGLTLTRANHVFHFDRWWNPAVEDQATDRAFRIGQSKNVFAHKFVALGTVEERIDRMIEEKKQMASAIVGTDESWLTELDNDTFRDLIALRRGAIVE